MPRDPGPTDPWGTFAHEFRQGMEGFLDQGWIRVEFEAFDCGQDHDDLDDGEDHEHTVTVSRDRDRVRMCATGNPTKGGHNVVPQAKWSVLKELGWGVDSTGEFVIVWNVDVLPLDDMAVFISDEDLDDITATLVETLRRVYMVPLPSSLSVRVKRRGLFSRLFSP